MSVGRKMVLLYFVVAYLLPMLVNDLFGARLNGTEAGAYYYVAPLTAYSLLTLGGTWLLFMVSTSRLFPRPSPKPRKGLLRLRDRYQRLRLPFALATLVASFSLLFSGMNSYRYTDVSLTELDTPFPFAVILLTSVGTADFFCRIFLWPREIAMSFSRQWWEDVLLAASLLVAANGTGSTMLALVALAYALFPGPTLRMIYTRHKHLTALQAVRVAIAAAAGIAVFGFSWITGESIKSSAGGSESLVESLDLVLARITEPGFLAGYGYYLSSSISSHYYSLLYAAEVSFNDLRLGVASALLYPLETALFRLDFLLGSPLHIPRPDIGSISRLNYVNLILGPGNSREGTSPGLMASFIYVAGSLTVPFCVFYLNRISRWIDAAMDTGAGTISIYGLIVMVLFLRDVFQSPFDVLVVFDSTPLYLILIWGACLAAASDRTARVKVPAPALKLAPRGKAVQHA